MVRKWLVGIVKEAFDDHATATLISIDRIREQRNDAYHDGYLHGKSDAMVEANSKIMEQQAHAWPFFKQERRGKTQ